MVRSSVLRWYDRMVSLIKDPLIPAESPALEQVRDYYDKHTMAVHPHRHARHREKMARSPQLYSRIGFAHEYRRLGPEELIRP